MFEEYSIFDIETDGLLEEATKIHCLSYRYYKNGALVEAKSLYKPEDIISFIENQKTLIGHEIIRFDVPVLRKLLGVNVNATLIDTLGLSWYLFSETRFEHGLEEWGKDLGIKKPEVQDWKNLTREEYIFRCEEDVKINEKLWFSHILPYLLAIYENDYALVERLIGYISFKLDCVREQEEIGCKIDVVNCHIHLHKIMEEIEEKLDELAPYMLPVEEFKTIKKPKVMYKKDGSISAHGEKWLASLALYNLPWDTQEAKVVVGTKAGSASSPVQVKNLLFSLGWNPTIYEDRMSKTTGQVKKVPQISDKLTGELCQNIVSLFPKFPYLRALEGLSMLKHRKGVFEGFLKAVDENGRVKATIGGFANTLRLRHKKPIVNLPKVTLPWGKEIRGLIQAPNEEKILCGSDISGLESNTKLHWIYFYDPEYVKEMLVPGFDEHLDIATLAKMMTEEEAEFYVWFKSGMKDRFPVSEKYRQLPQEKKEELFKRLDEVRTKAKPVNFGGIYGIGAKKLADTLGIPFKEADLILTTYWFRNKAIKIVSNDCITKRVNNQLWLYNPLSGFWYSLRNTKDNFSVLNQSAGDYCFTSWLRKIRAKGIKIILQMHDEVGCIVDNTQQDIENTKAILNEAMEEVVQEVSLNVTLKVDTKFGRNYSETH